MPRKDPSAFRLANPGYQKAANRKFVLNQYGLTPEAYAALLEKQHGVCAICLRPEPRNQSLSVDHSHATNKVRGLLCSTCNTAIGQMSDSADRLRSAAAYLERENHRG